ncbi:hypothetical protein LSTR_LSTR000092 [Laodelphax striatellus]|uniref:Uncharacterized protein n=1 Tax=Laodelphax striatellus TaxID=195883 RepID=A0A482X7C1_LAOST|nr:hypothetical protein LSTR_LSTR000092 [Laodelphax striatellus]
MSNRFSDCTLGYNEDYFKSLSMAKIKVEPQSSQEYKSTWNRFSHTYSIDPDECNIVEIVKPRHLRTPEVIDIDLDLNDANLVLHNAHDNLNLDADNTLDVDFDLNVSSLVSHNAHDNLNLDDDNMLDVDLNLNDAKLVSHNAHDNLNLNDDNTLDIDLNLNYANLVSHNAHDNLNLNDDNTLDIGLNLNGASLVSHNAASSSNLTDQQTSEVSDTIPNNTEQPQPLQNESLEVVDLKDDESEIIVISTRRTNPLKSYSSKQLRRELNRTGNTVIDLTMDNSFNANSNSNRQLGPIFIDLTKNEYRKCSPEVIVIDD